MADTYVTLVTESLYDSSFAASSAEETSDNLATAIESAKAADQALVVRALEIAKSGIDSALYHINDAIERQEGLASQAAEEGFAAPC